jgi:CsbD-like
MNWDQIEGNWQQFKGKVKEKWGKLTDDDLVVGLLPISWSSNNGNHLFVDTVDEASGRSSSIGIYLAQVAANWVGG